MDVLRALHPLSQLPLDAIRLVLPTINEWSIHSHSGMTEQVWASMSHASGGFLRELALFANRLNMTLTYLLVRPTGLWVGPKMGGKDSGCLYCFFLRLTSVAGDSPYGVFWDKVRSEYHGITAAPWWQTLVPELLETLKPNMYYTVLLDDRGQLSIQRHHFIPHPLCPACTPRIQDDAYRATTRFHKSNWNDNDTRTLSIPTSKNVDFLAGFIDDLTGIVLERTMVELRGSIPMEVATLETVRAGAWDFGVGRSSRRDEARRIAIYEAFERYAGQAPLARQTTVVASYTEVQDRALDPTQLVLHHPEQYQETGFEFLSFQKDCPISWVWGELLASKTPVLVPEAAVYYRLHNAILSGLLDHEGIPSEARQPFAYETSNGCAIHRSPARAVFSGLCELCERDSFLTAWYRGLPVTEVTRLAEIDFECRAMKWSLENMGYQVRLFNITNETGVPVIWAIVVGDGISLPTTVSSAGSHLDVIRAIKSALIELITIVPYYTEEYASRQDSINKLNSDESRVVEATDHVWLYTHPSRLHLFDFLLKYSPALDDEAMSHVLSERRGVEAMTDVELASNVVERLVRAGFDPVAVDITPPEIESLGLYAVRTIVPGLLPMTYGAKNYRLQGVTRLPQHILSSPPIHPFP